MWTVCQDLRPRATPVAAALPVGNCAAARGRLEFLDTLIGAGFLGSLQDATHIDRVERTWSLVATVALG